MHRCLSFLAYDYKHHSKHVPKFIMVFRPLKRGPKKQAFIGPVLPPAAAKPKAKPRKRKKKAASSNVFGEEGVLGQITLGPRRSRTTAKKTTKKVVLSQIRNHNHAFTIKGLTGSAAALKAKLNKKRSIVRNARPKALAGMSYPRTAGMSYPRTAGHRRCGC